MAATASSSSSLRSLLRPEPHRRPNTLLPSSLPFPSARPLKPLSSSTAAAASSLSTSSSSSSSSSSPAAAADGASPSSTSLDLLARHLSAGDLRRADDETRRLLIALAGDAAVKRGYVFFSEVGFIPAADLRAVDALWLEHSGGRFGYSVQRRLWEKLGRDFTRLFVRIGWMKKLDSEVEQFSYRAFPEEFVWALEGAPEGHLPLTNALRGTQLLAAVLAHPAFEGGDAAGPEPEPDEKPGTTPTPAPAPGAGLKKLLGGFKTDYSF